VLELSIIFAFYRHAPRWMKEIKKPYTMLGWVRKTYTKALLSSSTKSYPWQEEGQHKDIPWHNRYENK
jgi:hypothetical protein